MRFRLTAKSGVGFDWRADEPGPVPREWMVGHLIGVADILD